MTMEPSSNEQEGIDAQEPSLVERLFSTGKKLIHVSVLIWLRLASNPDTGASMVRFINSKAGYKILSL